MAFSGGDGSSGSPFLISNTTDLQNLYTVGAGTGLYFLQTNDITLGTIVRPFNSNGVSVQTFAFTYDGNGFRIKDGSLSMTYATTGEYISLFGTSNNGLIIKNLKIKNVIITRVGAGSANAPMGIILGTLGNTCILQNCLVESDCVISSGSSVSSYIGGIVGSITNNAGTGIYSCQNDGSVLGSNNVTTDRVGGIAGNGCRIYNCYNTGNVSGITNIGGITGYSNASSNSVPIATTSYNSGIISGSNNVGGIIGTFTFGIVSKCFGLQSKVIKNSQDPSYNKFGRVAGSLGTVGNYVLTDNYALSTMALSNGWL